MSSDESWHGACVCAHAASHTNGSPRSRTSPHGGASEESKTTAGYGYRGPNESLGDGRKAAPPPARRETTPGTMAWCHFNPVSEGASGPGVHIPRRWQHGDEPLARTLSPAAALLVCDNRQKLGENPVGPPSRGRPRAWVRVDRCLLQERPTPGASEGWRGPRRAHEVGVRRDFDCEIANKFSGTDPNAPKAEQPNKPGGVVRSDLF